MPELTGDFDTGKLPRIAQGSVTVTIARTVEPGHDARFLAWSDEMLTAVRSADGCLGAMTLRPGTDSDEYHMVFRFIDVIHLRRWERSPKREERTHHGDTRYRRVLQRSVRGSTSSLACPQVLGRYRLGVPHRTQLHGHCCSVHRQSRSTSARAHLNVVRWCDEQVRDRACAQVVASTQDASARRRASLNLFSSVECQAGTTARRTGRSQPG